MGKLLEILGNIGFDWRVALANLANFLVIFYLINRFLFPSIKKALSERRKKIDEGLLNAEKAKLSLETAETERQKVLSDAEAKAFMIKAEAEKDRSKMIEKARLEANEEGLRLAEEHNGKIKSMTAEAEKDIERRAVDMIVASVEKMLKAKMSPEVEKEYIKNLKDKI